MNEMLISRLNDLYAKTDYSITMTEFVYQQGRADLLRSIRECAKHLGYDDIEDLLSYVNKKEQSNDINSN